MENVKKLSGKTAMITGCSRGFGNQIMKVFAAEGADIIACARAESDGFSHEIEFLKEQYGIDIYPVYFDLSDREAIKAGIKEIKALKVPINILVNNAGIGHLALVPMIRMDDADIVFQINYFAQLQICQGVYNLLCKSNGCIINIASAAAIEGDIGNAIYGASKACMILLTKVLSKEMSPKGVRVNAIAPGLSQTDFADAMGEKAKETMMSGSLLHRLGTSEEIAKAVLFLASEDSSFITGQVLRVDGGM